MAPSLSTLPPLAIFGENTVEMTGRIAALAASAADQSPAVLEVLLAHLDRLLGHLVTKNRAADHGIQVRCWQDALRGRCFAH